MTLHVEDAMLKSLTVVLEDRRGALAGACEAIGQAGVNIEGMCCFASHGVAMLYVAVADGAGARRTLERAGLKVSEERDVAALPLDDRPGAAGRVLRRIAEAGISLELAYLATGPRLVVGAGDVVELEAALQRLATR